MPAPKNKKKNVSKRNAAAAAKKSRSGSRKKQSRSDSARFHLRPAVGKSAAKPKGEKTRAKMSLSAVYRKKKPRIAIVSLTSCEGCQFALLDLGEKFLEFANQVDMVDFRLIEDEKDSGVKLDLAIIEGNPVTAENLKTLKRMRARSKLLVVLGNCAAMGGIPEIKNYQEGRNTVKHVYRYIQGIENPPIREVDNFVKVDFTFPGCPVTADEVMGYLPQLLEIAKSEDYSKLPKIPDQPVCVQCKQEGNRCLLLDKKPCFGPMILGGCHAVCPTSRMMCQGCRGLRPGGNVKAMRSTLKNMMTDEEFENTTEIYGLRDDIEKREKKEK